MTTALHYSSEGRKYYIKGLSVTAFAPPFTTTEGGGCQGNARHQAHDSLK
jgi:hypothetical protein